jgi:cell division septum initiation protein DivIVA
LLPLLLLLLQELDEVTADFERVGDEHSVLQSTFTALKEKMQGIVDQQDTLLQQNTANSTALQERLAAAEVGRGQ